MKTVEVVAALANMTVEQVELVVSAVNASRDANTALAALEGKKKRGRKPGTKNRPKKAAALKPAAPKKAAVKKTKKELPDKFGED